MNRQTWEAQFRRQLKAQIGIAPEEIGLTWRQYYSQRYSVEGAIAHLVELSRLYPEIGVLPEMPDVAKVCLRN
jgi:hypothetical protein